MAFYSLKYLKTTSVCSTLLCFLSIPEMNKYFNGQSIAKKIESDEINKTEKFIITKIFKETLYKLDPYNFDPQVARLESLKFRLCLFIDKERIEQSDEIELNSFVERLLLLLHKELNKYQGENINKSANNSQIDVKDEKQVVKAKMKIFIKEYLSKISDQFYYLSKIREECGVCNNLIKYLAGINSLCGMYPDKTAEYLKRKNISVMDLFRHYNKTRLFTQTKEKCDFCKKIVSSVYRTKLFYTSPYNFILEICYSNEKNFELTIDEYINIQEFVERKDVSKFNYYLVGAIFLEENQNKEQNYVSISRGRANNEWFYFNVQRCTFNDLLKHKHLKMLFYTTNNQ